MNIERYVFEDKDGNRDEFTTFDAKEAKEYAYDNEMLWLAETYEFSDSEIVKDFRDS